MCGIVYANSFINVPVADLVRGRYKAQRHRGHEGYGFYIPAENRLTHNTRERRILKLLGRTEATEVLFHHRYPTSTINVRNACHPFSTKNVFKRNYVTVHNGVLWNSGDLADRHNADGIKYVSQLDSGTFNDSEALAFDIGLYLEGKQDKLTAQGSIAFVTVERGKDGTHVALYFGRNDGSPLKLTLNEAGLVLASEGEGDEVVTNMLYRFDYETHELTATELEIPTGWSAKPVGYYTSTTPRTLEEWVDIDTLKKRKPRKSTKTVRRENAGYTVTNGQYTEWANASESDKIDAYKDALIQQANGDLETAMEIADHEINKLMDYSLDLQDRINIDIASERDFYAFDDAQDEIYVLNCVVGELEADLYLESNKVTIKE